MKYCVVKNTLTIIEGSENTEEIIYKNALSAGFAENEVEILTEGEYEFRLSKSPKPIILSTEERLAALEAALMGVL